jgi:hypothetical protein
VRAVALILIALAVAWRANPTAPAQAQSCSDDYVTVETSRGTIIDIKPAPDPFQSADIYLTGPAPCTRMWMQVLKRDAENCLIGGSVDVMGVITEDAENNSWEINPAKNDYMTLGEDFTCR